MYWFGIISNRIFEEGETSKKYWNAFLLPSTWRHASLNPGWTYIIVVDTFALIWNIHFYFLCGDMITPMRAWGTTLTENNLLLDGDPLRMPFMPNGRKSWKSRSCVDASLSLIPRRDGGVRYGLVRQDGWWFRPLMWNILVMLIIPVMLEPPKSTVDRVLFQ